MKVLLLESFGTDGEIRTHTVLILNQVPPANWATSAYNSGIYTTARIKRPQPFLLLVDRQRK